MSSGLKVLHVAETVRGGIATYLNELHPHQSASFGRGNVSYVVPSDHRSDLVKIEDDAVTTFPRDGRNAIGQFLRPAVEAMLPRIREHVKVPVGVGFGIRDAATARAIGRVADAVVIGTRIVQVADEQPREKVVAAVAAFLAEK